MLEVRVAAGLDAEKLSQRSYPREGSVAGVAMRDDRGQVRRADELYSLHREVGSDRPLTQVLAVPFGAALGTSVRMAEDFARQAGLALELAEARLTHEQLEVQRERERIARLLQDNVLQRFSVGLQLQTTERDLTEPAARERFRGALDDIDETIRQVRELLTPRAGPAEPPRLR